MLLRVRTAIERCCTAQAGLRLIRDDFEAVAVKDLPVAVLGEACKAL